MSKYSPIGCWPWPWDCWVVREKVRAKEMQTWQKWHYYSMIKIIFLATLINFLWRLFHFNLNLENMWIISQFMVVLEKVDRKASTTEKLAQVGKTKDKYIWTICTFSRAWETALRAEGVLSDLLLAIVRITQLDKPSEERNKREVRIGLFRRVFKPYLLI